MSLPATPPKQEIVNLIDSYLQTNGNITAAQHKEIELKLVDAIYGAQIGDIKEIAADDNYIISNFQTGSSNNEEGKGLASGVNTPNGISTGERYGWAICNGKNGTINKKGKVAIGYDPSLYPLNSVAGSNTGGFKDAALVSHSHYIAVWASETNNNTGSLYDGTTSDREQGLSTRAFNQSSDAFDYELVATPGTQNAGRTSVQGTSGLDRNMQPYVVTLFIQRIPV